ncbi:MAG: ABC transporter ATP-binding protein [Deltaproteobacteria bacterium]|nr:MAG: ABC transporter ATP-binding protein [Deltaproteobacteria bacterium]
MKDRDSLFRLNKVSFLYKKFHTKAIDNISITIDKGHLWGIIGPNGSGKSTLLDLLSGFRRPSAGNIFFNGKKISEYNKKSLSRLISFVPQKFYINIPFQVKDIIIMGRYPFIPRFSNPSSYDLYLVNQVIKMLDLENFINRYITELSGGETQRVILACAFVQNTPVMLLDEPTSNMDISYVLKILNIIQKQAKTRGKTAIMAMHDINLASMYCDRLIIMKDGKVISYGDTRSILNEEIISKVFNVECQIYNDQSTGGRYVIFKKDTYKITNTDNTYGKSIVQ